MPRASPTQEDFIIRFKYEVRKIVGNMYHTHTLWHDKWCEACKIEGSLGRLVEKCFNWKTFPTKQMAKDAIKKLGEI